MIIYKNSDQGKEVTCCPLCGQQWGNDQRLEYGNIVFDDVDRVYFKSVPLKLPRTQYTIIKALVLAKGRGVTRSHLASRLGSDIFDRSVTKYIERTRNRFLNLDPDFDQIAALRGFSAYRWVFRPHTNST